MHNDFDVKTLSNKSVLFITTDNSPGCCYHVRFLDGSQRLATIPAIYGIDQVADFIVKENLLTNDGINEEVIEIFLTKYPYRERRRLIESVVQDVNAGVNKTRRDRQAQIYEIANKIYQGDFLIGTFQEMNEISDTEASRVVHIFHKDGLLCAQVIFNAKNFTVDVITAREQKTHTLSRNEFPTAIEIARYLVQWNYL